jgi:hypothetical protein
MKMRVEKHENGKHNRVVIHPAAENNSVRDLREPPRTDIDLIASCFGRARPMFRVVHRRDYHDDSSAEVSKYQKREYREIDIDLFLAHRGTSDKDAQHSILKLNSRNIVEL